ncbi:MAG: hypothetical protein IJD95_02925 [Clostridia bacterium]|nr:hypothetical protein [Clostridia bacterium]MBR2327366.1 hypothetical protein [Clostridia bacterium]
MERFSIEAESEIRGRGRICYILTSRKKLIEGCGVVRVYGVRCFYITRPETERYIDDLSSNRDVAVDIISKLAKYAVTPTELLTAIESLLG